MNLADAAVEYVHPGLPDVPLGEGGFKFATSDEEQVREWWRQWADANIGCWPAPSGFVVIDIDDADGERIAGDLGLLSQPTLTVLSARRYRDAHGKAQPRRHLYYRHPGEHVGNHKIGGVLEVKGDAGYVVLPPSQVRINGRARRYRFIGTVDEVLDLPAAARTAIRQNGRDGPASPLPAVIPEHTRNVTLTSLAGSMRRRDASEEAIYAALVVVNREQCKPPLPDGEVRRIAHSVVRYPPAGETSEESERGRVSGDHSSLSSLHSPLTWPEGPAEAAFHGLAGEIVRRIEPHSEADPVAILAQFLIAVGNVLGRRPHYRVEGDAHRLNEFGLLVGVTGTGRKGSALSQAMRPLAAVAPDWLTQRVASGLSSGEGLIWHVRDPIEKVEPIRDNKKIIDYQTVRTDPGIDDKRTLVLEAEFASVLRVLRRDGNTLSPVVRAAWDGRPVLQSMTKNSPAKATDAHISIIGHITVDELRRDLDRTEIANGFLNRFLLICVQRSKFLPDGGALTDQDLRPLCGTLQSALVTAEGVEEMRRDDDAGEMWAEVYPQLTEGRPGLPGAVTSRAEAHVLRLSMLYALLDGSSIIRVPHLRAALALWEYAEASAWFAFGDALGDPIADTILRTLRQRQDGMTQTEISNLFAGHQPADRIRKAEADLQGMGLIEFRKEPTAGRSRERWMAKQAKKATKPEDPLTLRSHNSLRSPPASGLDPAAPHSPELKPTSEEAQDRRDERAPATERQSGNASAATSHTSTAQPLVPPDQQDLEGPRERLSI
jgi:hypothetical protein